MGQGRGGGMGGEGGRVGGGVGGVGDLNPYLDLCSTGKNTKSSVRGHNKKRCQTGLVSLSSFSLSFSFLECSHAIPMQIPFYQN